MAKKKIFIEGDIKVWLKDILFNALNSQGKGQFEYTGKIGDADIMFSDSIDKLKQHLRGRWKGILAVFITDEPQNRAKTWNGKPYIEVSANEIADLILGMILRSVQTE
jgi:hypothetical protein